MVKQSTNNGKQIMSTEFTKLTLTEIKDEGGEMYSGLNDFSTAGLVQYCLRSGCLDSEYHLALRTQKLRALALRLADELVGMGGWVAENDLKLIDVFGEVVERKRLFTDRE